MADKSSEKPENQRIEDQPNLQNRGLQEDHPNNPVRTTGSTRKDQETGPTGEPDPGES